MFFSIKSFDDQFFDVAPGVRYILDQVQVIFENDKMRVVPIAFHVGLLDIFFALANEVLSSVDTTYFSDAPRERLRCASMILLASICLWSNSKIFVKI